MVYGSFFGGIYIKELDPDTGLSADGNPKSLGICISRKGPDSPLDGPEGAAVIYVPETGYYYLFQSYGWLGENYDIRVGRSRCVTGPYVDRKGRDLKEQALGEKVARSYRFRASCPNAGNDVPEWAWDGFRAPGHGVPFYDPQRKGYFFIHHVRDGAQVNKAIDLLGNRTSYRRHYMMIRPMFMIDGWPAFSPEPYVGEALDISVPADAACGMWEMLFFDDESNDMKTSSEYFLSPDSPYFKRGRLHQCWDFENRKLTIALTGTDNFGVAYWGKLLYNHV